MSKSKRKRKQEIKEKESLRSFVMITVGITFIVLILLYFIYRSA